jgi:hypothetical protein
MPALWSLGRRAHRAVDGSPVPRVRLDISRLVAKLIIGALIWAILGCQGAPQPQGQLALPSGNGPEHAWNLQPMSGGAAVFWACIKGDRLYYVNGYAWRGRDDVWPGGSLAVVAGGCRRETP